MKNCVYCSSVTINNSCYRHMHHHYLLFSKFLFEDLILYIDNNKYMFTNAKSNIIGHVYCPDLSIFKNKTNKEILDIYNKLNIFNK